ncbi:MAG: glycosyltransferase [Bryobacteraceae bacterium]
MAERPQALLAFASTWGELATAYLERLQAVTAGAEILYVSELPPPRGFARVQWIPWFPRRTLGQNIARIRGALRGRRPLWTTLVLDRKIPYWQMRAAALWVSRGRLLLFNEELNHFALRPGDAPQALRWLRWRLRDWIHDQTHPGGWFYTQLWRLRHPKAYVRPLVAIMAGWMGRILALGKRLYQPAQARAAPGSVFEDGISVIIPSRDGRALLERLLPGLSRQLRGILSEILVVDNGSTDGSAAWLRQAHPEVTVIESAEPLSFAAAVNRGIEKARFRHTLLLNNDMEPAPGFVAPLRAAFGEVPHLFCAAAQIFFPPGKRREETGKAVWRWKRARGEFFVHCIEPLAGENLTPVLYGSGGCSLFDTAKLRALGGLDEGLAPAYVEDLDLGFRAWQRGWPSVFVSGARAVHHHRATTSRFYRPEELQTFVEINFLRFLVRTISDPRLFLELWRETTDRLNWHAAQEPPPPSAMFALRAACRAYRWLRAVPRPETPERAILAAGSGAIAVFPGRRRDRTKPLIFVLSAYPPWPLTHGGAVRMENLMRRAAQNFDQVLIAFCPKLAPPAPQLLDVCAEVILVEREGSHLRPMTERPEMVEEHDQPAFHAALRLALERHRPDLVQMEFTHMGLYAEDCRGVPTVLVEHDITLDLYRQLLRERDDWETRQQWRRWERFERTLWPRVDCVVTMSSRDAAMVEGARRVEVIPNGVDTARFTPAAEEPEPRRLLFIGSFAHLPNLLGLEAFLREAWPRLREAGAVLHVISGADPEHYLDLYKDRVDVDLRHPQIEWEAYVGDVRPAYRRAEVVVAPLLASAGTNIKILEAMAMGKAIVAMPAALHGLEIEPGREVMVAASIREMADAVLALLRDPDARRAMGRAARRKAEGVYDWDRIAQRQTELYRSLLWPGPPARVAVSGVSPCPACSPQ